MRLVLAIALVASMGGAEIERAQQVARSRDAERAEFHHRYVFALRSDIVTELEVITEFRRLVLITEEHLRLGDQMFSRGLREAETAMAPTRGMLTFRSTLRFHPLNTYADVPAFKLAMGPASDAARVATAPLAALDTQVTGEYSAPYKDRGGKRVRTLMGATLQTDLPTSIVGQSLRPLGVVLSDMEVARTTVDFGRLE
jgi:hypothetical protein